MLRSPSGVPPVIGITRCWIWRPLPAGGTKRSSTWSFLPVGFFAVTPSSAEQRPPAPVVCTTVT
jgi:hypothetical protein